MKKLLSIMTMLVVMSTMTFNANAQVQIYNTYNPNNISDWSFSSVALVSVPPIQYQNTASFDYTQGGDVFLEYTGGFTQISNMNSIDISYSVKESTNTSDVVNFEVFLSDDNVNWTSVHTYSGSMTIPVIDNFAVTNNSLFASPGLPTYIRIKISTASPGFLTAILDDFSITGIQSTTGINEDNLSDNLDVYSYNKSVYISSNESIDATISVYNLNGQIVKTENINLSSSISKVDLTNMNAGVYIVSINDGFSISKNKFYIH